ncbi:MAG: hypothetical protein ACJAZN_003139, partial [Planctomycetota bacterium]
MSQPSHGSAFSALVAVVTGIDLSATDFRHRPAAVGAKRSTRG